MTDPDEEIARHLAQAMDSGELQGSRYFGKPLPEDEAWNATPLAFRMPFKVLRNAGYRPPEIEIFHQRARLVDQLAAATGEAERLALGAELSALEQAIALRLEGMRISERL